MNQQRKCGMLTKVFYNLNNEINIKEDLALVLKGGVINILVRIIVYFSGMLSTLLVAKYYGPSTAGMLAIILAILNFLSIFSLFGVDAYILKLIPEFKVKFSSDNLKQLYLKIMQIVLFASVIFASFILMGVFPISKYIFKNENLIVPLILSCPFIVLFTLCKLNIATVRAYSNIKAFNILSSLQSLGFLVFIVGFYFVSKDINAPIYALFLSIFTAFIVSAFIVSKLLYTNIFKEFIRNFKHKCITVKSIISESNPFFIVNILNIITAQAGILILGILENTSDVGIYSIVLKVASVSSIALASFNSFLAPKISELHNLDKKEELQHLVQTLAKQVSIITIPICVMLIVFGKQILGLIGKEYTVGYSALILVVIGQVINAISGSGGLFLNMTGWQRIIRNINIISTILYIVLNIILIPHLGILGAAIAYLSKLVISNLSALIIIKYKFGFFISFIPFVKNR